MRCSVKWALGYKETIMADFKYEVIEEISVLSENNKGYTKELNLISYNGADPKYDIRSWSPEDSDEGKRMGKGITLNEEEMQELYIALKDIAEEKGWN